MVQDIRITTAKQEQHALKEAKLRALFGPNGTRAVSLAFMCPKCSSFKLFDKQDQDLAASHGHRRDRSPSSKFIDNACTHCGFFSIDRSDWPKWQGKLLTEAELQEKKSKGFYLNRDNILHTRDLCGRKRIYIHTANLARENQVSYQEAYDAICKTRGRYYILDFDAAVKLLIKKQQWRHSLPSARLLLLMSAALIILMLLTS